MVKRYNIGKIEISNVNLTSALSEIDTQVLQNESAYICVTNSRTSYIANHDKQYCDIQNNSFLTVPDGAPLVWIAKNRGYSNVGKVSGKDLMDATFNVSVEKNYSHYFYGCSQKTIDLVVLKVKEKFEGIDIRGAVSPPFQPLENFDIDSLADELNTLKPTFFWCGLGAPKQERLMALLQPKLDSTICIGVGLAFEYFAGNVKRAPKVFRVTGFEWLFRILQQPKRITYKGIVAMTSTLKPLVISVLLKK